MLVKTTFSKCYDNVIHLDAYGLAPKSYPRVIDKVRKADGDVIVEGIYNTAEIRMELLKAYTGGGEKMCIWIDTPLDIIESRFHPKFRPKNLPHPFEPPSFSEGWDKIVRITNG